MCGISVIFRSSKLDDRTYDHFLESLKKIDHRGPDDEGIVLINTHTNDYVIVKTGLTHPDVENQKVIGEIDIERYNLAFGHKRLSIIDLTISGHQPMKGIDGSWIVFNGEIYNYIELREELKKHGCFFNTGSDTEVILEAYRIWGADCLNKFNGMWSICIWDAPNRKLFISNDRFGVKPLYYKEENNGFVLVSETKQLSCFKDLNVSLNNSYIKDFAAFGFSDVNENTMYQDVYRFKKSHFLVVNPLLYKKGQVREKQDVFYSLKSKKIAIDEREAIQQFRDLLYDAVKIRMRADVDFGFALSGGLDSSAILYTARNIIKNNDKKNELLGFSAIFPGHKNSDESQFVKIVADDLPCTTIYTNAMEEFNFDAFESHVSHQDEPLGGTSFFAQWSVYKKAKESGIKILFNGQGADEVFAGYHHHFYRYCRQLLMQGKLPEYFSQVKNYAELKEMTVSQVHKIVFGEIKLSAKIKLGIAKFDHALLRHWNKTDTLSVMMKEDFNTFQLPTYLRVDDRNSMAFSLESRHPFMDYRLVEFGYSLPDKLLIKDGWQKYIVRKSMYEMPESISWRKDKKGFTTPQDIWIQKYQKQFDEYLDYNEKIFGSKCPSKDNYRNYALGAWLKMNQI